MTATYQERADRAFATPVETPRLVIRPWQDGDEQAVAEFLNADGGLFPRRQHSDIYDPEGSFDEKRVRDEVFPAVRRVEQERPYRELYIYRKDSSEILGLIEFYQDQLGRDRVGYFIRPDARRGGYAFEAYAACVNRAMAAGFLTGDLYAHTSPENTVSQKFLEKAGFERIGPAIVKNTLGEDHPVIVFSRPLDKPVGP